MKRKLVCFCITLLFLLVFSGCGVSKSTGKNYTAFTKENNLNEQHGFKVNYGKKHVKLSLQIEIQEGKFIWEVKNPKDEIVWSGTSEGDKNFNETKLFETVEGDWLLSVKTENSTGNYDFKWDN